MVLVGSALHLVAVVVGVEGPAGVETGAGPQDGLAVQLQGPHPVLLLYAMTQQLPVSARGPAGQPGGDGVRGVTGILHSGGGAEEIHQGGGDFRMPVPPPFFPLFLFPSLPLSWPSQNGQIPQVLGLLLKVTLLQKILALFSVIILLTLSSNIFKITYLVMFF